MDLKSVNILQMTTQIYLICPRLWLQTGFNDIFYLIISLKFRQYGTCFRIISVLHLHLMYKRWPNCYEVMLWFSNGWHEKSVVKSFGFFFCFKYHHCNEFRHKHLNFRRHMYFDKNVLRLRKHLFTIYLLNIHVFHQIHSICFNSVLR